MPPKKKVTTKDIKRKASKSVSPPKVDEKKVKTNPGQGMQFCADSLQKTAVDELFYYKNDYHVYVEGSEIYSTKMQFTSMRNQNNNNKFYIVQILISDEDVSQAYLYKRWGRTGEPGTQALRGPLPLSEMLSIYKDKVADKSGRCKYKILHIKYDTKQAPEKSEVNSKVSETVVKSEKREESKLPTSVQDLIKLIFDLKIQLKTMEEIGYDIKKMPLGSLGEESIKEAYQILSDIMNAIKEKAPQNKLLDLSSDFFSRIPHDFGRTKMKDHVLMNDEDVRKKLEMLKTLSDMKIADSLLESINDKESEIDQHYKKLNTKITPLNKSDKMYDLIQTYINNNRERYTVKINDIFEIEREGEEQRYNKSIGNDMLLWHGSRVSNYGGILSQGLRIAPPEAPVSGYNYGKGIYFADMFSKSADYCRSNTSGNTILIMLVKVAIGKPNVLQKTDFYASNLPQGTDSCLGWGKIGPPESSFVKTPDGITIPIGKSQSTKSKNYMQHNEYIVYGLDRARIKYLIRAQLN